MTNELKDILLYELSAVTENNNILNEESTKINGEENIYGIDLECQALTSNGILGYVALNQSCTLTAPNPTTYGELSMVDSECRTAPNPLNSEILGANTCTCTCDSECSDTNTGTTQYYYSWCACMRISVYGYNGNTSHSYNMTSQFTPQSLPSVFIPANHFSITDFGTYKEITAYATGTTTPYFTQTSTGTTQQTYSSSIGGSLSGHEVNAITVPWYVKQTKGTTQSSSYPTPTVVGSSLYYPSYHTEILAMGDNTTTPLGYALISIQGIGNWHTGTDGYIYVGSSALTSASTALISRDGYDNFRVTDITNNSKSVDLYSNNKLATYDSLYNLFSGYYPLENDDMAGDYRLFTDGNDPYSVNNCVYYEYDGESNKAIKLSEFYYAYDMPAFFKDDTAYEVTEYASGSTYFETSDFSSFSTGVTVYGIGANDTEVENESLVLIDNSSNGASQLNIEFPGFTISEQYYSTAATTSLYYNIQISYTITYEIYADAMLVLTEGPFYESIDAYYLSYGFGNPLLGRHTVNVDLSDYNGQDVEISIRTVVNLYLYIENEHSGMAKLTAECSIYPTSSTINYEFTDYQN